MHGITQIGKRNHFLKFVETGRSGTFTLTNMLMCSVGNLHVAWALQWALGRKERDKLKVIALIACFATTI